MTPEYLRSSYKQYKADSDAVATWLANTGRKCAYPHDLLSQETLKSKPPKLKGRARKLARDAREKGIDKNEQSTSMQDLQTYTLAMKEFVPLASWISESTRPVINIPGDIVALLDRTIEARRGHNNWWSSKDDGLGSKEYLRKTNETHSHFIGVLEEVREVLRPRMPTERANSVPDHETGNRPTSMVNRFSVLEVSQPASSPSPSHIESTPKTPRVQSLQFTVEQEPDVEEVTFALCCLYNDLANIREYLQKVWMRYKRGAFDLVSASLVTNTAVEFAQGLEEDFIQTFPKHANFEQHANNLYLQFCADSGCCPTANWYEYEGMSSEIYNRAEEYLVPTHMLLCSMAKVINPKMVPILAPSRSASHNTNDGCTTTSATQNKFVKHKTVLYSVLPEFCFLTTATNLIPVEDKIVQGVRIMIKNRSAPLWLTFAMQTLLDAEYILQGEVSRGFEDLQKCTKAIEASIWHFWRSYEELRGPSCTRAIDKQLMNILDVIKECVNEDIIQRGKNVMLDHSRGTLPALESHFLLRRHPLLCGLICFKIKVLMQEATMATVNARNAILYAAHLYNALRQEKLFAADWKDMNIALILHRTEDMFIGSFPITMDDYFKRYALAMGYSAANFASNRGCSKKPIASKVGSRRLNTLSLVSRMFIPEFREDHCVKKLPPEDVEKILKTYGEGAPSVITYLHRHRHLEPPIQLWYEDGPYWTGDEENAIAKLQMRQKKMNSRVFNRGSVHPVELLNALLEVLESESAELAFDHLRLHVSCSILLRAIREELHTDLEELYGAGYLSEMEKLPAVVGFIFMPALKKAFAGAPILEEGVLVTRNFLERAAKEFVAMTERGDGQTTCVALEEFLGMGVTVPDIITQRSGKQDVSDTI